MLQYLLLYDNMTYRIGVPLIYLFWYEHALNDLGI
jgi:hypothetical protein